MDDSDGQPDDATVHALASLTIRELRQVAVTWSDEQLERLLVATQPTETARAPMRQNLVTRRRIPETRST